MDFFEKLEALHANDVSPKKNKEVSGVNKEEVLQKVMDFVDKYDAKQKMLEQALQVRQYAARFARLGQAGRAGTVGKSKRTGYTFKKTKNGLMIVDKERKRAAFILGPNQQTSIDAIIQEKGLGIERIKLAGVERPEGKSGRRKLKNGPNGRHKGGGFGGGPK